MEHGHVEVCTVKNAPQPIRERTFTDLHHGDKHHHHQKAQPKRKEYIIIKNVTNAPRMPNIHQTFWCRYLLTKIEEPDNNRAVNYDVNLQHLVAIRQSNKTGNTYIIVRSDSSK